VAALRPLIESIVSPVIRRFLDSCRTSSGDFYQEVALAVPSEVMRSLFEIDEEPWRERVHSLFRGETGMDSTSIIGALVRFFATMDEPSGLLRALQEPGDDGSTLSSDEVIANATLLVMAGVDTTAGLIANMVHSLLRNPEVFRQLRAEPSRCNEAVEETLRFEPPALSCSRYTPHALELGDVEIPAGSHLLLCIGAANRDPKIYDSPNEFRLRGESSGLLTFGGGRHFCLGAALARLEAVVVLETLLRERVALELASPVQWRTDNPTVRLPAELQLRQASERPR
jgi:cytochrome P450